MSADEVMMGVDDMGVGVQLSMWDCWDSFTLRTLYTVYSQPHGVLYASSILYDSAFTKLLKEVDANKVLLGMKGV
jgi:hypothetical protein